jgi:hypothetical protein
MTKKTKKYRIRYSVEFETIITVGPNESISDVVADIDIPEGEYVEDSFEVIRTSEVESE